MRAISPRLLIEDWLPIKEVGLESQRERAAASALPPLYFLHVWWARRPIVASTAAAVGSLLPTWSPELRDAFADEPQVSDSTTYRAWFLRLCGIWGDPISARAAQDQAKAEGVRIPNPFTYRQAFRNNPPIADVALVQRILQWTWSAVPQALDPTAGGGSIPFALARFGVPVAGNDLNPVAASILSATLRAPALYGSALTAELQKWGGLLVERTRQRLLAAFPSGQDGTVATYLFARSVACPRTGKPTPLIPSLWINKESPALAVRVVSERGGEPLQAPEFELVRGPEIDFDPDQGTIAAGTARSVWDSLAITSEYIRSEARAGRMASILYAVAIRGPKGQLTFRAPSALDLEGLSAAEELLNENLAKWDSQDIIPVEDFPDGNDMRPLEYGMPRWRDMFSHRQLVVHGTFSEEFRTLATEVHRELPRDLADAVLLLLGQMQSKALNYDSFLSSWHAPRGVMRSVFDRHDFAFKWTYAEFEGARELFAWCLSQLIDAYDGVVKMFTRGDDPGIEGFRTLWPTPSVANVTCENAADLKDVENGSVALVCIDPPYYNNVMYAELSDYFYVWEKRTIGLVYPDFYARELTDKKGEAVANESRFADAGRRRKELATADYEAKMAGIFAECGRVLRDDGVLTVMFTHQRAEAWDTLGMGLLQAGFQIETSWPVNTESEQSLHQANKNAAASTIFLVCRKRPRAVGEAPFFEDLEGEVRAAVREAVDRFATAGLRGVDLLLSSYGPALSVISANWPVFSSDADPVTGRSRLLRPEEALDAARSEVVRMQRRRLVGTDIQFDAYTDFELIAWETFKAAEFPFDEARRLALATGGLDVDELARARLIEKKAGTVVLLPPERRLRRGADEDLPGVRADAVSFPIAVDAVHTVMYVAETDGLPAARALIDRAGLATDQRFLGCLQGLVNAIPRTRTKAGWARKEAEVLDRLCAAYFPGIVMPRAQEAVENLGLWT